ncbi:MAG: phosphate ABC transporter permease PstA [Gammaproteobacteria bacterium]|nr:phosphate ABC transporter permease PstA [Gammaproteobacteria bacterium]NND39796.1 phosphate ABC transporter permease PstA [Pseudomonadales bacterium]NNL11794.1 phosphate ABC transporter permease PstA [Pseudomonadales bacterium]NNM10835.1 phosphate ABC transporter permease PstA [Pseudomonadales bacterium]
MSNSHSPSTIEIVNRNLAVRYARERRFRRLGLAAVLSGFAALIFLMVTIVGDGWRAFQQGYIELEINFDAEALEIDDPADDDQWQYADYTSLIRSALRERFPALQTRKEKKLLYSLVSPGADYQLANMLVENREWLGQVQRVRLPVDDDIDVLLKGYVDETLPEDERRISNAQIELVKGLKSSGEIALGFNHIFFTAGDSREPEQAGIRGALIGSFLTLVVTLSLSFPIAVAAAIYLEEFAPRNRITDIIEVNINNLAAVPSIVFGLLGLAVFLNLFGMPRSVPLVGGIVLTLMTLPTIIISSRAALKAVPPSIREAALGLGASKMQVIFHHVLPLALPGMLTGAIIGMAQALGETAPLLMIGMVAFIVDIPAGFTDPATVLPVQIFLWSDSPERGFVERTSAAIMVLLFFLIAMNAVAVLLRRRFERRW